MPDTDYTRHVSRDIDVIYSPDDGGWYFHHYGWHKTSQLFPTRTAALLALDDGTVAWE